MTAMLATTSPQTVPSAPENALNSPAIASMLMQLFAHWQLSTEEQLQALGAAPGNRALLSAYRKGSAIRNSRDALERAGHLLSIHKNLRLLFPHNRELAYAWMTTPNLAFDRRRPIDTIGEFGFAGLLMVRAYLDRARGQ